MKTFKSVIWLGFIVLFLLGCKPSDRYVGEWYALADDGELFMIDFSEGKEMTITHHPTGNQETFAIGQTGAGVINNLRYYAIEIDGVTHYLVFENRKDEDNAILIKPTNFASDFEDVVGDIIYQLNRQDFPENE